MTTKQLPKLSKPEKIRQICTEHLRSRQPSSCQSDLSSGVPTPRILLFILIYTDKLDYIPTIILILAIVFFTSVSTHLKPKKFLHIGRSMATSACFHKGALRATPGDKTTRRLSLIPGKSKRCRFLDEYVVCLVSIDWRERASSPTTISAAPKSSFCTGFLKVRAKVVKTGNVC